MKPQLKIKHVEAICGAMFDALRDEDNWNEDGVNWNFIDADVYEVVNEDATLDDNMYRLIFDLNAKIFLEDYAGLRRYDDFHNKIVDEVYGVEVCE